uniref:CD226 antigen isoform X3 n=1 Tax=Monopterus albus TaxID=43700 RepID=UPI0009B3CAEA|nr:CD226 antigen isoform X3 [Monopterus albus]
MEAVQKDHWYFVVLLFLPFIKVAVQKNEVATVRLEEGMVLDCLCPWDGSLSLVSWTKAPDKNPIAILHPELGVNFSHRYRERIEFLRTTLMDGSISIRNVTHQDIGLYHCSVQTFPQGPWTKDIQVEDLDDPPEDDNSTEPPSPEVIVANTELIAEENSNLTIICNHQHNGSVSQALMKKMPQGQGWNTIGVCKKEGGNPVSENYSDRGRVVCADSLDVSLQLTAVMQEDGGYYRCIFTTDVGEQTTTVLLTVLISGGFSLPVYMMYIYIGAGAAGLVLLIVMIILAVRQRKKNRREEYRVKLNPHQRQPNFYENIPVCPRITKKSRQIKNVPVYANLQTVRSHKTRCQSRDK